jgi:hypothetical protein
VGQDTTCAECRRDRAGRSAPAPGDPLRRQSSYRERS